LYRRLFFCSFTILVKGFLLCGIRLSAAVVDKGFCVCALSIFQPRAASPKHPIKAKARRFRCFTLPWAPPAEPLNFGKRARSFALVQRRGVPATKYFGLPAALSFK
jgi:hypothetical protein